jgi:hypothetical protein
MYRLVKNRDLLASQMNTTIILSDLKSIELLLDLLEHDDLTVGVMSSQILSEIHVHNEEILEKKIQESPAGFYAYGQYFELFINNICIQD